MRQKFKLFCESIKETFICYIVSARLPCFFSAMYLIYRYHATAPPNLQYISTFQFFSYQHHIMTIIQIPTFAKLKVSK